MTDVKQLSNISIAIAASLVFFAGLISFFLRLHLGKKLAIASIRTIVQLVLVGYALKWLFFYSSPYILMPVILIMFINSAMIAVSRPERTTSGLTFFAFLSMFCSGFLTIVIVTTIIIKIKPWYHPQYMIPLLGMILGNNLTGLSLSMDSLLSSFSEGKNEIEMELAHGASAWEAAREKISSSIHRGMMPSINAMTAVGIVSLPGMMTGQILSGENPITAIKYQIVVMFMLTAATSISTTISSFLIFKQIFNSKHQIHDGKILKK